MQQHHKALLLIAAGAIVLALPMLRESSVTEAQKVGGRGPASVGPGSSTRFLKILAWQTSLENILEAKSENDPRLDTEFRHLTPEQHSWLISRYHQVTAEDRTQRGKIAFLITRDLRDQKDVAFLKEIMEEQPCRSLANCEMRLPATTTGPSVDPVTLHYPQMTVLYQLEKNPDLWTRTDLREPLRDLLLTAVKFPAEPVQQRATSALDKLEVDPGPTAL